MERLVSLKVAVVGAGYVGLTTAVALAYIGHRVTCVDKDAEKLALLKSGKSPIYEPGLEELLEYVEGRIAFTGDIQEAVPRAEVIIIAVGTPSRTDGNADTDFVEKAACEVGQVMLDGRTYTVVIKSTVPIGTGRRVAHVIDRVLQERKVSPRVFFASNPEFLREGQALYDFFYPDRIVVGAEHPGAVEMLRRLYRPILEQTFEPPDFLPRPRGFPLPPLMTTDPVSAEMMKYAANAFLALKISFINEIAGLCEKVGADVTEVARGMGLDPRIGPLFLQAGLGWGGSCFPKDTAALLAMGQEHGCDMRIVRAAREVNFRQRLRAVEKLQEALKGVRGRIIGVLGLAFKPGTDDVRESPALDVIRILCERGAHVRAHDPVALGKARCALNGLEVEFFSDPYALAEGAEALLLATDWPEYRRLDLDRLARLMRTPVLLDGRNVFDPNEARRAGFLYPSHLSHPSYTLVEADIRDIEALRERLSGEYDVVVHLAAKAGVRPSVLDPVSYYEVNVRGTLNLLELAREWGVRQFVFASSSSVYGANPNLPWREDDHLLLPVSPYGATKLAGETLGRVYSHLYGIRCIALRIFTAYGPRQRPDLAIHKFARLMLEGKPIPVYGDGSARRDYTYIDDLVRGIRAAMDYEGAPYEVMNLGNHHPVSVLEVIRALENTLGLQARLKFLPFPPGDVPHTWADIEKAQKLLGYEPGTPFEEGIMNFIRWLGGERMN